MDYNPLMITVIVPRVWEDLVFNQMDSDTRDILIAAVKDNAKCILECMGVSPHSYHPHDPVVVLREHLSDFCFGMMHFTDVIPILARAGYKVEAGYFEWVAICTQMKIIEFRKSLEK
jgi:hypothetical protein